MKRSSWLGWIPLIVLVAAVLSGCGAFSTATPPPLPTVVLDGGGGATPAPAFGGEAGVAASGVVVPAQTAQLAFPLAAEVVSVAVAVGDPVESGQVLARLAGSEQLQAALSAAELEVLAARQALEGIDKDLPQEQAAALRALNDARKALRAAEQRIAGFGVSSEPIDVEVARSNVALAQRALDQARKDFQPYENKPENNLRRAALLSRLSEAQKRYDAAVEQLNRLTGVTVPAFDQEQAQTGLEIAQAELKLAEDRYALLQAGPDPAAVELAQARLQVAEDRAAAARAVLGDLELKAPFAGVITSVDIHPGEWAVPGRAVFALADVDHLWVETTDLSERDVPVVAAGQPATILVKALNLDLPGRVTAIAPLADALGGDVVYKTTLELDNPPPSLRAGMSVEIHFETAP